MLATFWPCGSLMSKSIAGALSLLHANLRLYSSLIPGQEFTLVKQFAAADIEAFVALTGDYNAIHTDHSAATAAGLPSPIVPGILLASLFPAIIGSNFPAAIYLSQTLKFRQYAEVGALVKATVKLEKLSGSRATFATSCHLVSNNNLCPILVEGQALALLKNLDHRS